MGEHSLRAFTRGGGGPQSGVKAVWSICLIPTTGSAGEPSPRRARLQAAELADIIEVVNGRSLGPEQAIRRRRWLGVSASRGGRAATHTGRRRWGWPTYRGRRLSFPGYSRASGRGRQSEKRSLRPGIRAQLGDAGHGARDAHASQSGRPSDEKVGRSGQRSRCRSCAGFALAGMARRSERPLLPVRPSLPDRSRGAGPLCGVRENRDGVLYTLVYGRPISAAVDPIEKKPLFHFLPGSKTFSLATVGCNFTCSFCQNSEISQMPRDQRRDHGPAALAASRWSRPRSRRDA